MKRRYSIICASVSVVFWIILMPATLFPCGPFFRVPVFVSQRPEDPSAYISGNLGVLQSTYSRSDLLVAWRILAGRPLTKAEKTTLLAGPSQVEPSYITAPEDWMKARNSVPGFDQHNLYFATQRELKDYQFFINCNGDAFVTATSTLRNRIAQFGAGSPEVKEWLTAQNMVFKNCASGQSIPEPLPPSAPPLLRADRAYQIAAANFYATNYDTAAEQFINIAKDKASPWHDYGLFLAARAYIRKVTVGPLLVPEHVVPANAPAPLDSAEKILQQVVSDPSLNRVHDSAERLLSFVAIRLHPQQQLALLQTRLANPSSDSDFGQHVIDYFHLIDEKPPASAGDMAEWITAVRGADTESAVRHWKRQPQSLPSLVAALMISPAESPDAPALITAALKLPADSPAYATAQYYAAKLRYDSGQLAAVRQQIDSLLAKPKILPRSAANAFVILRSQAAANLSDFANFAVLPPVATWWDDGSEPTPEDLCARGAKCPPLLIDPTAANMLNHMPVAMLIEAAHIKDAPFVLRRGTALVAWERAVLINDFSSADSAAHIIAELSPSDARDLEGYFHAQGPDNKRFAAAMVMLRWPGLQPQFYTANLRDDPMRKIDNYRQNWWCKELPMQQTGNSQQPHQATDLYPKFFSSAESASAKSEIAKLRQTGTAPNYLGGVVIAWARDHRDDPLVPEALYLVVKSTRYGCTDENTGKYSKDAFELLHKNYPQSDWTKQTPYYFKD
jgi:hypothetical protein